MHMIRSQGRRSRLATLAIALGVAGALSGCDDFMRVTNPGAIEVPALESPNYIQLMTDGVIGDFQASYAWTSLFSGVFTDELRNHHTFFENGEIDRRDVNNNNGTYILAVYNGLHRTRFLADSVASRMRVLLADSASRDLRLARVQAYSGYAWTLLGEQYCETPINRSQPVSSTQMLQEAVKRFEAAIPVALAARSAASSVTNATARNRLIAGADSVANFARVGAARAYLNLNNKAKALELASAVTPAYSSPTAPGFSFLANYRDGNSFAERRRIGNPYWEFVTAGRWFSITGTPFEGLNDPRVPHSAELLRVADGTQRTVPNSPSAFSTYNATPTGAPFTADANIRVASALEARYIVAEAQGMNAANVAFLNERRSVGGQSPLPATLTAAQYATELREQRARDLYLDGHRMGDLRRYKQHQGVDLWPKGAYFGSTTQQYGTQECWPVPLSEQFF